MTRRIKIMFCLLTAACLALFAAACGTFADSDYLSEGTEISTEYNSENEQTSENEQNSDSETVTGDNSGTESKDSSSEDIGEWTPVMPGKNNTNLAKTPLFPCFLANAPLKYGKYVCTRLYQKSSKIPVFWLQASLTTCF